MICTANCTALFSNYFESVITLKYTSIFMFSQEFNNTLTTANLFCLFVCFLIPCEKEVYLIMLDVHLKRIKKDLADQGHSQDSHP